MKKAVTIISVAIFCYACTKVKGPIPVPEVVVEDTSAIVDSVYYSADIQPIIQTKCAISSDCHSKMSFFGDYTSHAGLKADVDNGTLLYAIITLESMPKNDTMSDARRNLIKLWADQGGLNN